jgi:tetratricopeptide (TPR) repeat protein
MARTPLYLFMLLPLALLPCLGGEKLPKVEHTPIAPTQAQKDLIREGIRLHDQKDYDGAVAKYAEVLAANPYEVTALHEMTYSYFAAGMYEKSLKTARIGASCSSNDLSGFRTMIGNSLDELGRKSEALDIFQAAVKDKPRDALLWYNFAVTLRRAGKTKECRKALESALLIAPGHASSHYLLGKIYRESGYRIPAILAWSRFLEIEPRSQRAEEALGGLQQLLGWGVTKGDKEGSVQITLSVPDKALSDEGDFTSVELLLSMGVAIDFMGIKDKDVKELIKKPKNDFEKLAGMYSSLASSLGEVKPKGFAARYYAPHFAGMDKTGMTGAFLLQAFQQGRVQGAETWRMEHEADLGNYASWLKFYAWPEK